MVTKMIIRIRSENSCHKPDLYKISILKQIFSFFSLLFTKILKLMKDGQKLKESSKMKLSKITVGIKSFFIFSGFSVMLAT